MTKFETILYEEKGPVAVITYNRVERRNAWNAPMYREIVAALEQANESKDIGAIVITNNGPVYSAGADFKAAPEPPDASGRRPSAASLSMQQDSSWLHLLARSKPNIIAVNGAAVGMGVTQILAADIRMGGKSSSYSFPFLPLNVMPELGCTAILPRLVGFGRALDICLTAQKLDAEEALRIGLITRLSPDEKLLEDAVALATQMASYPPLQMKLTRELFYSNAEEGDINAFLKRESHAFIALMKARVMKAPIS